MANTEGRVRAFREERPRIYFLLVAVACGAAYFVLRFAFARVPAFNTTTLLSPAAGVGPVLGLFLGPAAVLGCTAGEALTWALLGAAPLVIVTFALERIVYLGIPCALWYAASRRAADPFPRFSCSRNLGLYLAISLVDAIAIVGLEVVRRMAVELPGMDGINAAILGLNSLTFLVYIGMPLLVGLNRSPLVPFEPAYIRRRGPQALFRRRPTMSLTQRAVLAGIVAALGVILVMNVLYLAPYPFYQEYGHIVPDVFSGLYALTSIFVVVIFLPLTAALRYLERGYIRPVESVKEYLVTLLDQVRSGGAASARVDLADMAPRNEVASLIRASEQLGDDLLDHIERLKAAVAERERADAELSVAHRIQMSVIPQDFSAIAQATGVDVHGLMLPAREVGGDFFDVLDMGRGRVGFIIGDVSGKGVPAALFMMHVLNELRYQLVSCENPGAALSRADEILSRTNGVEIFVTVFACVLDTATGRVTYANAGHNPPWIVRERGGAWLACDPERVLAAYRIHAYTTRELQLAPGEGLVLYTDGVSEAQAPSEGGPQRFFGMERLAASLSAALSAGEGEATSGEPDDAKAVPRGADHGMRACLERVLADVESFADGAPQSDDITLLGFTWGGSSRA